MSIKRTIKRLQYKLTAKRWQLTYTRAHKRELVNFSKAVGLKLKYVEGEEVFVKKWSPLYDNVNVDFYRFYSQYLGKTPDIVSDDIFHILIEPILNNQSCLSVYSDKNMFEKLVNPDYLPVCILRKMDGDFMDRDYHILDMTIDLFSEMVLSNTKLIEKGRLIVKPSIETGGGNGVRLFIFDGTNWKSNEGELLSLNLLNKLYHNNFIMQECIEPSAFVKQFNETSYSTLRIFTYRSVVTDIPHFIGGYLRVGAKGSFKDNIWGGGYACPINNDGTLGNFASDSNRKRYDNINGISLKDNIFLIPQFDKIMDFVKNIALLNTPNRLLSFDIMLDEQNEPHMIEFNIKHQTVTTVQTLQHPFFGEFTDEVISYCCKHKDKICYSTILRIE